MKPAFPEINKIPYEGRSSKNPLAFKHYDSTKLIEGRSMAITLAYWHTFRNALCFGVGTASARGRRQRSCENARNRVLVAFEFIEKLGAAFIVATSLQRDEWLKSTVP